MKVSVVIPAYNCARTIATTLQSVFEQSRQADEIIVLDDGSKDETAEIIRSLGRDVTLLSQANAGAAASRNALCGAAQGDLIAFLDADDLWHPSYLAVQTENYRTNPGAVGFFTSHVTIRGNDAHVWAAEDTRSPLETERILGLSFLRLYNSAPGRFNLSWCCVTKSLLDQLGPEPFREHMAEDWYFFNRLTLFGDVIVCPAPLAAYRTQAGSLSSDPLKLSQAIVNACQAIRPAFQECKDPRFGRVFAEAVALKQRLHSKILLNAGDLAEARRYLTSAIHNSRDAKSMAKSAAMLLVTYLPNGLQPDWLAKHANWKGPRYSK